MAPAAYILFFVKLHMHGYLVTFYIIVDGRYWIL